MSQNNFSPKRWQKLAGILKEEVSPMEEVFTSLDKKQKGIWNPEEEKTNEKRKHDQIISQRNDKTVANNGKENTLTLEQVGGERQYKYNTVNEFLSDYAMGGSYDPKEVAPNVRAFAIKHNFDIPKMIAAAKRGEIDEQKIEDISPESMSPSREDEEDWRIADQLENERIQDDEQFGERMPAGWEDDGFNAVIINDIGAELSDITATVEGVKKAEMLKKRLEQAIEALKKEINSQVQ